MKGSRNRVARLIPPAIFACAFVTGALVTFGAASLIGDVVRASAPLAWRQFSAAAVLFALATIDLLSARARKYCPLGLRRQTPQALAFRWPPLLTAAWWGFDTGLAVTTFRVATLTWGALVLTLLGLATWRSGIAYGVAFALPLSLLLLFDFTNARLAAFMASRHRVQAASALALGAAALLVLR